MNGEHCLTFHQNDEGTLLLPHQCSVSVECYDSKEVQRAVVSFLEGFLHALASSGKDLRALDGITVALDARHTACELQNLPDGIVPLEMGVQSEWMELARTVSVKRGDQFRFHIVLRAGIGLMTLSSRVEEQALACACLAHEAAHVEHEGHLYKTFPELFGYTLDCGDRSRQTFLKSLDVWSEYSACRSSAQYRPEALEDFDQAFCLALEESRSASRRWIESCRDGGKATDAFREIQQVFGDAFICAGSLLGHLHGLEMKRAEEASRAAKVLSQDRPVTEMMVRLGRLLHELYLSESSWQSVEVFAPIYDLLCEMMALHGMAFARHGDEWRIIMSDELVMTPELKDFLIAKAEAPSLAPRLSIQ